MRCRIVDLVDPFRDLAEHATIVDLLERLAAEIFAADLADKQDHRRRILARRVEADRCVGHPRTARYEANAGPPGQLAVGLGHVRRAALLPADNEPDAVLDLAERLDGAEKALAGDAERQLNAVADEIVHQDAAAGSKSHSTSLAAALACAAKGEPISGRRKGPQRHRC